MENGSSKPTSLPNSVTPMERKKKSKAVDRERRCSSSTLEIDESNPIEMCIEPIAALESQDPSVDLPSTDGVLLELHIGVFKDLASADGYVQVLVTELQEIQKMYDRLDEMKLIGGGLKLEAEKEDGLNTCAPSLRYAVRRLIRRVSSSRELYTQWVSMSLRFNL
ncbi:DNA polymerase V [Quillaja saponaria]|uniref:DNA polymerase V n=1 Tax=Quillaja saponaria TaxID=32244 RepID=A0AAD7KVH1_QUISA|nr:DNA polymerase V [Quillaja saponaria]